MKKRLEELGWYCIRSAGSKGKIDLVALKDGEVKLIQCKYKCLISHKEKEEIKELEKNIKMKIHVISSLS